MTLPEKGQEVMAPQNSVMRTGIEFSMRRPAVRKPETFTTDQMGSEGLGLGAITGPSSRHKVTDDRGWGMVGRASQTALRVPGPEA